MPPQLELLTEPEGALPLAEPQLLPEPESAPLVPVPQVLLDCELEVDEFAHELLLAGLDPHALSEDELLDSVLPRPAPLLSRESLLACEKEEGRPFSPLAFPELFPQELFPSPVGPLLVLYPPFRSLPRLSSLLLDCARSFEAPQFEDVL